MTTSTRWKNSPLGPIPFDWTVEKGEVLADKITKGASPKWQGFSYVDEGILFVTSENVRDGFLDVSNPKFVEQGFNEKQKNSTLARGDILINLVGASIGRSCRFETDLPFIANINQAVCLFRPNDRSIHQYLHQFLQAPSTIRRLLGSQADGARPNVSLSDLRTFSFLLPPLPEQQKIAAILSTWDRAIELTEKLIAAKQKRKQALMQQLLTGKAGDCSIRLLGNVCRPKQWATISQSEFTREGYPVYGANGQIGFYSEYNHEEETVAITCRGATCGSITLVPPKCYITGNAMSLDNVDTDITSTRYLYYVLERVGLLRIVSGSAQPQIVRHDLCKVKVPLPSKGEQQRIVDVLDLASLELDRIVKRSALLTLQKKGLMQQLLTGKVRVKVDAETEQV